GQSRLEPQPAAVSGLRVHPISVRRATGRVHHTPDSGAKSLVLSPCSPCRTATREKNLVRCGDRPPDEAPHPRNHREKCPFRRALRKLDMGVSILARWARQLGNVSPALSRPRRRRVMSSNNERQEYEAWKLFMDESAWRVDEDGTFTLRLPDGT